jgi:hypothetical protein
MACFISSNDNRFYVALEQSYAAIPALSAADRCSGVHLRTRQTTEQPRRRDKTGTRTYRGISNRLRRQIEYEFRGYLTGSESPGAPPRHGAFFQAALGSGPLAFAGGITGSSSESGITFSANHGLSVGQAIAHDDEIRFVAAIRGEQR